MKMCELTEPAISDSIYWSLQRPTQQGSKNSTIQQNKEKWV